jgi:two-component system, NarL family, response regulator DesR
VSYSEAMGPASGGEASGRRLLAVAAISPSKEVRRAIASSLDLSTFRLVAEAETPGDLPLDQQVEPDVLVLAAAHGTDAAGWLRALRERSPASRLVVVGTFTTPNEVREALDQGADGLVAAAHLDSSLGPTVLAVAAGQAVFPSELRAVAWRPLLSRREKQILAMVVMGFTNAEIARRLFIADSTVKSHLSSAFRKLGVRSRSEATQLILDPERGLGTGILAISQEDAEAASDGLRAV